ncbi:MAG: proteasome accessory factor PafA2 family protein, partial [Deltaproteobacteria bacterium]|nr:proteasome accessory factor PafA2 family protein [Deltaproteobacteria bacterium]
MFDRLLGLETEYAIRFVSARDKLPTSSAIYDELAKVVGTLVATRPGRRTKRERFLANGGLLSYEEQPQGIGDGLVETGTPECRGPSEVILYQRANEDLLVRAMSQVGPALGGEMTLLKNCRDAEGHTYGAQENYEVELARGGWLFAWRAGLIALVPLMVVSVVLMWIIIAAMVPTMLGLLVGIGLAGLVPGMKWLTRDIGADGRVLRMLRPMIWVEYIVWGLSCVPFMWLYRACAFRAVRRGLVPFLISRPIVSGAGTLVDDRFALSEKGVAVRGLCRRSLTRGIFMFEPGNLFKALHGLTKLDVARFAALFGRRQRMQLGFSDSNMAQAAEYLKVATTCLVIDMIEAGALPDPPRVRRPLRVLRQIVDGDHATALALQHTYL